MRLYPACYPCLENLAKKTVELARTSPSLKEKARSAGARYLVQNFSPGKEVPAHLAGRLQALLRGITGDPDPFFEVKRREMEVASLLVGRLRARFPDTLRALISFAALGNSVDFFLELEELVAAAQAPVEFVQDDIPRLEELLRELKETLPPKRILYFADNAGEVYFDLPLVAKLESFAPVTYVVKESPVQNDLTLADLHRQGLESAFRRVVSTGTNTPGLLFAATSSAFRRELAEAGLLFAKGMGYYETLPELELSVPCFYLLKAKCAPVASSLGVPLESYVARLVLPHEVKEVVVEA